MTSKAKTMTPAEALAWLAGLEKAEDFYPRMGVGPPLTGKVPVLPDLREPCYHLMQGVVYPDTEWDFNDPDWADASYEEGNSSCNCQGRNWQPKRGRDALYDAMSKDGWDYDIVQRVKPGYLSEGRTRLVIFIQGHVREVDSDDYLAAVKALRAAGHGGQDGN